MALWTVFFLKGTPGQGILLHDNSNLTLMVYCDLDWANCPLTHWSIIGYFNSVECSELSWKTKKEHIVSRSST